VDLSVRTLGALLAAPHVEHDILLGVNAAEMARRGFREIARVAGSCSRAIRPGQSARQLQASSGLLYDVFNDYDPDNLLLQQSLREVLDRRLEAPRLAAALDRMRRDRVVITDVARPRRSRSR
jgi:ATP-dependent Lhr-like helicase